MDKVAEAIRDVFDRHLAWCGATLNDCERAAEEAAPLAVDVVTSHLAALGPEELRGPEPASPLPWTSLRNGNCTLQSGRVVGQSKLTPERPYNPVSYYHQSEQSKRDTVLIDADANACAHRVNVHNAAIAALVVAQQERDRLRTAIDLVSGALCDAATIPVPGWRVPDPDEQHEYGESVRALTAERDIAQANLAEAMALLDGASDMFAMPAERWEARLAALIAKLGADPAPESEVSGG